MMDSKLHTHQQANMSALQRMFSKNRVVPRGGGGSGPRIEGMSKEDMRRAGGGASNAVLVGGAAADRRTWTHEEILEMVHLTREKMLEAERAYTEPSLDFVFGYFPAKQLQEMTNRAASEFEGNEREEAHRLKRTGENRRAMRALPRLLQRCREHYSPETVREFQDALKGAPAIAKAAADGALAEDESDWLSETGSPIKSYKQLLQEKEWIAIGSARRRFFIRRYDSLAMEDKWREFLHSELRKAVRHECCSASVYGSDPRMSDFARDNPHHFAILTSLELSEERFAALLDALEMSKDLDPRDEHGMIEMRKRWSARAMGHFVQTGVHIQDVAARGDNTLRL